MAKKRFDKSRRKEFVRSNEQIRIREVLLIVEGKNLGVMATSQALAMAKQMGLDLVEVAPTSRPPVCHIMEYGKFMYDKQKKDRDKKRNVNREKEISFRYVIDDNDLNTKANQCRRFLEKGHKVKLMVKFKQREKAHKDQGFLAIKKLIDLVSDVASVEKEPSFEGSTIIAKLDLSKGKDSNKK